MVNLIKERYCYKNGALYNKYNISSGALKDNRAGCVHRNGYRRVQIEGKLYAEQNLIWIMFNGKIPEGMTVDHINKRRLDNRLENLRLATRSQQQWNKNSRGFYWDKTAERFRVSIMANNKAHYVGVFKTECEARDAYIKAKEVYHN